MPSDPAPTVPAQLEVRAFDARGDADLDVPPSTHDAAGVDLTQIDMMLALTPRERLRFLYVTAFSLGRLMPNVDTD
jgi:hypothetical protein